MLIFRIFIVVFARMRQAEQQELFVADDRLKVFFLCVLFMRFRFPRTHFGRRW